MQPGTYHLVDVHCSRFLHALITFLIHRRLPPYGLGIGAACAPCRADDAHKVDAGRETRDWTINGAPFSHTKHIGDDSRDDLTAGGDGDDEIRGQCRLKPRASSSGDMVRTLLSNSEDLMSTAVAAVTMSFIYYS